MKKKTSQEHLTTSYAWEKTEQKGICAIVFWTIPVITVANRVVTAVMTNNDAGWVAATSADVAGSWVAAATANDV